MKHLLNLVGLSHRQNAIQRLFHFIEEATPLLLVREPSNPHDPNAIQVYVHVGYVKAKQAVELAPKMDSRAESARIMDGTLVEARGHYVTLEIDESSLGSRDIAPEPSKPEPKLTTPRRSIEDDEIPF